MASRSEETFLTAKMEATMAHAPPIQAPISGQTISITAMTFLSRRPIPSCCSSRLPALVCHTIHLPALVRSIADERPKYQSGVCVVSWQVGQFPVPSALKEAVQTPHQPSFLARSLAGGGPYSPKDRDANRQCRSCPYSFARGPHPHAAAPVANESPDAVRPDRPWPIAASGFDRSFDGKQTRRQKTGAWIRPAVFSRA